MLDDIDIALLEQTSQNPGRPLSNSVKPLLEKRKGRTLYDRLVALEKEHLIEVDRSMKNVALATITEDGMAAIKGRVDPAPKKEARSPDKPSILNDIYVAQPLLASPDLRARCKKCGELKEHTWVRSHFRNEGLSLRSRCKKCDRAHAKEILHRRGIYRPYNRAKDCSLYLGVHIAERVLGNYFKDIQRMPITNPGFDFICKNGHKIDVKSSCLLAVKNRRGTIWSFAINRNQVPKYFLCIAFDNRASLKPMHVWLIPAEVVNHSTTLSISNNERGLAKWSKFEKPLDKVLSACETLRGGDEVGSTIA